MNMALFFTGTIMFFAMGMSIGHAATSSAGQEAVPATGALDAEQAQELIHTLDHLLIVDVRTQEEFSAGHLKEARLVPVQELVKDLSVIPADRPVLFLCRSGGRARFAYEAYQKVHPEKKDVWYLNASPEYHADGSYVFR